MLIYDPNATNPSNFIQNEVHTPITGPNITPDEGVFYTKDFEVEGRLINSTSYIPLTLAQDYIYSPQFISRTGATGNPAYSYILLIDYTRWSHVRLTYRGSGGAQDLVLMAEIATAGNFDTTNIVLWESFRGELLNGPLGGPELDPRSSSTVFLLASKLNALALALGTPAEYLTFINTEWESMSQAIGQLEAKADNWETYFSNYNGGNSGSVDLSGYPTTQQMTLAINNAVQDLVSNVELDAYPTTAEMGVAITAASSTVLDATLRQQTSNMTWFVNPANTGPEDGETLQTGFTTIREAFNKTREYVANGWQKNILLADGTYSTDTILKSNIPDNVTITGNIANPELCIIDCSIAVNVSPIKFEGVTFQNTSGGTECVKIVGDTTVTFGEGIVFGEALNGAHVWAQNGIAIHKENYKITGSAKYHWIAAHSGGIGIHCNDIELIGIPHFSESFIFCVSYSEISPIIPNGTITGTATGKQFNADWSSTVNTINRYTPWPGNIDGTYSSRKTPQLVSDLTVYVDETADPDIANGLTLGTAFTTIIEAYNYLKGFDQNGFAGTLSIEPGSYAGITIKNTKGDTITVHGNGALDTVTLTSPLTIENATVNIDGLNVGNGTPNGGIKIGWNSKVTFGAGMNFGQCTAFHLKVADNAFVLFTEPYRITGGASEHFLIIENSTVAINTGTITVIGTPNFTNAFCVARNYSRVRPGEPVTFSGAATGQRYVADRLSIIDTAAGGPNWFPGDAPGTEDNGALYI